MDLNYPTADRDDIEEDLHSRRIADPYRYLEDPDSPRTVAFVESQNSLSAPYLASLSTRAEFLSRTTELLTAPRGGVPWESGGRYFVIANPGHLDQDQLFVADGLDELLAGGRLLLDPNGWSVDGAAALAGLQLTQDGAKLAYARSEAGSDWRTIRVLDVATGAELADELRWTKWVDPTWLPDGASFLYWRYPAPDSVDNGDDPQALGAGQLLLHRLGAPQSADELVWERPAAKEWMVAPWVTDDGRYLVLTAAPGTDARSTIAVRRLALAADGRSIVLPEQIVVVDELTDANAVLGSAGDVLYLRTERNAPTGALVAVDLTRPDAPWTTLAAGDSERVFVDGWPARDVFVLLFSVDAAHRVEVITFGGELLGHPDLGGLMAVSAVHSRTASQEVFLGTSSFTHRLRVYRLVGAEVQELAVPGVTVPDVRVERRHGVSADGTKIPMTVVRRADRPATGPAATLLYGYGGFDIPILPSFSALFAAWVEAGGVLAVANLRGGGEFGKAWHEAGMLERKQNVFDDLYGCAEALIADGLTTAAQLAVHGRSNGGLLVGAALTQRPELWAACLPTVGVLDMLRFHLFTIGWAWTTDYGSPEDAAQFEILRAYSPLHALRDGVQYPPTLICTGDHDDRVVPAHSLKFGAELQHCQAGPGPVLLRIDRRAGHGLGKPARALAAEYADQLAFAAEWTGLAAAIPSEKAESAPGSGG